MTFNLVLSRYQSMPIVSTKFQQVLVDWTYQLPQKNSEIDVYSWKAEDNTSEFLFSAICTDVLKVVLRPTFIWSPGVVLSRAEELDNFAQASGYSSWDELSLPLLEKSGGEFAGYLIKFVRVS